MIRPFEEVLIECRRKGFDALRLIRQLQTFRTEDVESFASHTELAWLAAKCSKSNSTYHEFCDFWIQKSPSTITVVLRAAREAGFFNLEKSIRQVIDEIMNNKQCYHDDELANIELFEEKWKVFIANLPPNKPLPENPSLESPDFAVDSVDRKSIFISYTWACRPDDVHKLADKLQRRFNVWLNKNIIQGDDINASIATGIENCDLVVVCFSEAYKTRPNCYKELCHAERCKKPIVFISLHPNIEERGPCWIILQFRQYVKFYNIEMLEQTTEQLLKIIENLISLEEKPFVNRPAPAERFFPRKPAIYDTIVHGLQKSFLTPSLGAVAVVGAAGVGKTTMVSHILDEFKNAVSIDGVLWTSCKQWNEKETFESIDIVNNVIANLSVTLRRQNVTELSAFADKKFIFVFDEIYNAKILEIVRHVFHENNIPLVLLFRNDDFQSFGRRSTQGWLIDTINIAFFSDAEMQNFLLDTWLLQGKVSDSVIRDNIAKFKGDPGLATIWAQRAAYFEYGPILENSVVHKHTEDLTISGAPRFEKYYARAEDERAIKEMLCVTAKNPNKGFAVVLGGGGNGKSTIMSNIIYSPNNQRFFREEVGVSAIFWINCYRWNKPMMETDRSSFVQKLLDLGRKSLNKKNGKEIADKWLGLENMVEFYRSQYNKSCLFILDDCFNAQILTVFRNESITSPCCVISRYQEYLGNDVDFTGIVQIKGLSEAAILEMLQTTHRLKDALSVDKLMHLAKISGGSPLVASLIAGQLNNGGNKDKAYKKLCDEGLLNLAHKTLNHSQKDDELTAYALFRQAIRMLDDELEERYMLFLLYDPVEPIHVEEITMFWDTDEADALESFEFFVSFGLATETRNSAGKYFLIHQILHEALFEKAKSKLVVDDLWHARIAIFNRKCPIYVKQNNMASKLFHTINKFFLLHCDTFLLKFISKISDGDFFKLKIDEVAKIRPADVLRNAENFYHWLISIIIKTSGKIEVLKYFGELCPAAFNFRNRDGNTLLHEAYYSGREEVVRCLADLCSEAAKVQNNVGETALHHASYSGDIEIVKYLAELCPDAVKVQDNDGDTVLHQAAYRGKIEVVKYLAELVRGAAEIQNNHGDTALHAAAYVGEIEVVKYLAEFFPGAVKVQNDDGDTVLHVVAYCGKIEDLNYLAELSPKALEAVNREGETPLSIASRRC